MKTPRKILSVILVLAVALSFSAAPAFADSSRLNLLCFGDSTANGFSLEDYNINGAGERVEGLEGRGGLHDFSPKASSALLKDRYSDDDHFTSLCFEGQRTTEVRAFLNENFAAKVLKYEMDNNPNASGYFACQFLDEDSLFQRYAMYKAFNEDATKAPINKSGKIYKRYNKKYHEGVQRYANLNKYYTEAVRNADVIVLDGVMSNLINYQLYGILFLASDDPEDAENVYKNTLLDITDLPYGLKTKIKTFTKRLAAELDKLDLPATELKQITDLFAYGYAAACIDSEETVKDIHRINPDAEVIMMGPSNIFKDLNLKIDDISIDFGKLFDIYAKGASSDIKSNAKKYDYAYTDFISDGYDTIFEEIARAKNADNLLSGSEHLSKLILTSLRDRITTEVSEPDDEINALYDALDPAGGNKEMQKRLLQMVIDSIHLKNGYDFSALLNIYSSDDLKDQFTELSKAVFNDTGLTEDLDAFLFLHTFTEMGRGAGIHPSKQGCIDKYNAASRQIDSVKKNGETLSKSYLAKAKALYLTAKTVKTSKSIKLTASKIADLRNKLSHMRVYKKLSGVTEKKICETEKYLEKAEKCLKAKTK